MSASRCVLAGDTYLLSCRVFERRFLLRPDSEVTQVFEYVLARALEKYGVLLHAYVVMSNHSHMVLTDPKGKLPLFMKDLDGLVARALNCHWGRWGTFWEPGSYSAVKLLDRDTVFNKMVYTLLNPVAAGLVGRARGWGGATSAKMRFGESKLVQRPGFFFRDTEVMPRIVRLKLTAPAGFEGEDLRGDLIAAVIEGEKREKETRREPLGMAAVRAVDPNASPTTPEARRTLRPKFAGRTQPRCDALQAYVTWRGLYAAALKSFRGGDRAVEFPVGTWHMVQVLGCVVQV